MVSTPFPNRCPARCQCGADFGPQFGHGFWAKSGRQFGTDSDAFLATGLCMICGPQLVTISGRQLVGKLGAKVMRNSWHVSSILWNQSWQNLDTTHDRIFKPSTMISRTVSHNGVPEESGHDFREWLELGHANYSSWIVRFTGHQFWCHLGLILVTQLGKNTWHIWSRFPQPVVDQIH